MVRSARTFARADRGRHIDCIDLDASERRSSGSIVKESFRADALPVGPAVFKDPRTVRNRIYVNQQGKAILDACVGAANLTGLEIEELGLS